MKRLSFLLFSALMCAILGYFALVVPTAQGKTSRQNGDSCGHVTIVPQSITEFPACPTRTANIGSYQTKLTLISNVKITHFDWVWKTFWCANRGQLNANGYCVSNLKENNMGTANLQSNTSYNFSSQNRTPDAPFAACGIFQNDFYFWYTYNGVKCQSGTSTKSLVAAGGVCVSTTPDCPTSTPTPTPTNMPTPTNTPVPTETPTPTQGITPTNTPVPTETTNNCGNTTQSGTNNNSNCNEQNQNQNQTQTQNNNQSVNITLNQPTPEVLAASTQNITSLPSTGTPIQVWEILSGITPIGVFLRKIAKK